MPKFESSIGSTEFESTGGGQVFTIPDNSGPQPQQQQEFSGQDAMSFRAEQMRRMQAQNEAANQSRIVEAKRRVEMLVGIGRVTVDIPIQTEQGQIMFTLRTLKGREQRDVEAAIESAPRVEGTDEISPTGLHQIRIEVLANALYSIDNVSIDMVLEVQNQDPNHRYAMRRVFVEELDDALAGHLFLEYQKMLANSRDRFAVKTAEDVKEVAEQIKKSS
jgi:hypothetical protein